MAKKLVKKKKVSSEKKEVEFYEGDLVIIKSLKVTKDRHGINSQMRKMLNNEYTVQRVDIHHSGKYPVVHISYDELETSWAFAPPDLTLVKKCCDITSDAMPNNLIMFDPNELI